ncbi:MAG: CBS domain-containing protein [Proteobacteria bacterium]|nr:MAG: CBS domain-containing protein [Pseudomonadota bacterium]QKK12125.1 MAG: CBS domain-containing protein [Pseudomonadota bacterium]
MKVTNWMQPNPRTITSDALVSEAKRILSENNLRALPVVDDGELRGLITRASCLRATEFVTRTQDVNEFDYLVNRLKVKDLMVRRPATVKATDTMEHVLQKGQTLKIGQFPVLEGDQVVGLISATEVFKLAAIFLGVFEKWSGITLAPIEIEPGTVGRIAAIAEGAGAIVHSIYPIGQEVAGGPKRVILRFKCTACEKVDEVVSAFEGAGYKVLEFDAELQKNIEHG